MWPNFLNSGEMLKYVSFWNYPNIIRVRVSIYPIHNNPYFFFYLPSTVKMIALRLSRNRSTWIRRKIYLQVASHKLRHSTVPTSVSFLADHLKSIKWLSKRRPSSRERLSREKLSVRTIWALFRMQNTLPSRRPDFSSQRTKNRKVMRQWEKGRGRSGPSIRNVFSSQVIDIPEAFRVHYLSHRKKRKKEKKGQASLI